MRTGKEVLPDLWMWRARLFKTLVGESAGASPAVGKTEGVTWVLFAHFDVVIDDFFDQHKNPTRNTKTVPTDRRVCPLLWMLKLALIFWFLFLEPVRITRFDMRKQLIGGASKTQS